MDTRRCLVCYMMFSSLLVTSISGTTVCPFTNDTGTLDMSYSDVMSITNETFTNCSSYFGSITIINLSHNSIRTVDASSFSGFYNLKTLNLSHNSISVLHNDTFKALSGVLEYLYLGYNAFTTLTAGPYNLYSIEEIHFEHNNISYVEPGVVDNTNVRLRVFNVSYNSLSTFEPWPYLVNYTADDAVNRIFDLSRNQISQITNNMNWTYNLLNPYEVKVYLQYNQLESITLDDLLLLAPGIDSDTSFTFFYTFYMNITHNPFVCDCNSFYLANSLRGTILRWSNVDEYRYICDAPSAFAGIDWLHDLPLYNMVCDRTDNCPSNCSCQDRPHNDTFHIDCSGAGLTEFPDTIPDTNRTNIEMFLDNNYITDLKNTSYLSRLYNLSMSSNKLTYLDESLLRQMSSLVLLDVRNNQIRTLPPYIQKFNSENVKLSGNHLYCDCDSLWMADWVGISSSSESLSLTCDSDKGTHSIGSLNEGDVCQTIVVEIIMWVFIGIAVSLILLICLFVYRCPYETKVIIKTIFRIHPWDKYKVDDAAEKDRDMYLVFHDDPDVFGWVNKFVRNLRKKKPFYKILNPYAFTEGGSEIENIEKFIGKSKRILVILSEGIFNDKLREHEIKVAEDNLVVEMTGIARKDDKQGDTCDKCIRSLFSCIYPRNADKFSNAGRIIYVKFNDQFEEQLKEDPWPQRLAGKTVLSVGQNMFMSKLRYELPPKGNGSPDDRSFRIVPARPDIIRIKNERKKHDTYKEDNETVPLLDLTENAVVQAIQATRGVRRTGNQFSHVEREPSQISGSNIQLEVMSVHKTVGSNTQDSKVNQLLAHTRRTSPQPSLSVTSGSVTSVRSKTSTVTNIESSNGISATTVANYSNRLTSDKRLAR